MYTCSLLSGLLAAQPKTMEVEDAVMLTLGATLWWSLCFRLVVPLRLAMWLSDKHTLPAGSASGYSALPFAPRGSATQQCSQHHQRWEV
uniref:Uncharacterized protein n=1 Tax=Mus musculus TaxID=10090 RepID=Q3UUS2_MOUSE|nr:unnamed protein product [Mus musculus]BAE23552.1 unnamed protein product [Mus musculus]